MTKYQFDKVATIGIALLAIAAILFCISLQYGTAFADSDLVSVSASELYANGAITREQLIGTWRPTTASLLSGVAYVRFMFFYNGELVPFNRITVSRTYSPESVASITFRNAYTDKEVEVYYYSSSIGLRTNLLFNQASDVFLYISDATQKFDDSYNVLVAWSTRISSSSEPVVNGVDFSNTTFNLIPNVTNFADLWQPSFKDIPAINTLFKIPTATVSYSIRKNASTVEVSSKSVDSIVAFGMLQDSTLVVADLAFLSPSAPTALFGDFAQYRNPDITSNTWPKLPDYASFTVTFGEGAVVGPDIVSFFSRFFTVVEHSADYDLGFAAGISYGESSGYASGFDAGFNKANNTVTDTSASYIKGKQDGISAGSEYTFYGLISSVVDVPVRAFTSLFDFNILGVNLTAVIGVLLMLCFVMTVVRLFMR